MVLITPVSQFLESMESDLLSKYETARGVPYTFGPLWLRVEL